MELKLFNECNNKCNLCNELRRKPAAAIKYGDALKLMKEVRLHTNELTLAGGEPLLHPESTQLIEAAAHLRFKTTIRTNGRLFAKNHLADALAVNGVKALVAFMDYRELEHDAATGVQGSFREAIAGLVNMRLAGLQRTLDYTITSDNSDCLLSAVEFFKGFGVHEFRFELLCDLAEAFPQIKEVWDYGKKHNLQIDFANYQRELSILLNNMFTGPIVTQFEITNTCNHQCVFCYHHSPHLLKEEDNYFKTHKYDKELVKRPASWHSQRIDFTLLKSYVEEAAKTGCRYIQLGGGGEPTTHPDLMAMLRLIKRLGLQVQVFTNLTRPSPEEIREIVRLGADVLELNVSGVTAETYAKIHSVPKTEFARVVNNLKHIKQLKAKLGVAKPEIRIMNPICSINYNEIPKMVDFARENGASAVYLGHLQTTPLTDYLLLKPKQIREVNKFVVEAQEAAERYSLANNFYHYLDVLNHQETLSGSHTKRIFNKVGCLVPFFETQVHLDGQIAPCCLHPTIFHIKGRGFTEMWNSQEYKAYREKVLGLYNKPNKPLLCRGCRMCVYQEDIQRFYNGLGELTGWLGK